MYAHAVRLVLVLIIALITCEVACAQDHASDSPEVHFPQYNKGHLLYVPVKIADHSLNFLVDTGFSVCAISKSHHELPEPVYKKQDGTNAAGNRVSFQVYKDNWIELPSVRRVNCLSIELDTSPFESLIGLPINGVLGANFLSEVGLGYDSDRNTVYFGLNPERRFDIELEMDYEFPELPRVKGVEVDGLRHQPVFQLDTGSSNELTLPAFVFDALVRKGKIHSTFKIESYVVGGTAERKTGRLREANIWGTTLTDVPVYAGKEYGIGLPLLRRFDFYFDFAAKQLCIKSNSNSNLPFLFDNCGFYTQHETDHDVVMKVVENSPAQEAGVEAGDIVLAVDGEKVQLPSMDDVSGQRYGVMKLTLMRDGKTLDRTIELRDFRNTTAR